MVARAGRGPRARGVRLHRVRAALALVKPAPAAPRASAVTVNDRVSYQRIAGFGASEAFGQAETLQNAPPALQEKALSLLYSTVSGAGLTILRNEISADSGTTIEPHRAGQPAREARLPAAVGDRR